MGRRPSAEAARAAHAGDRARTIQDPRESPHGPRPHRRRVALDAARSAGRRATDPLPGAARDSHGTGGPAATGPGRPPRSIPGQLLRRSRARLAGGVETPLRRDSRAAAAVRPQRGQRGLRAASPRGRRHSHSLAAHDRRSPHGPPGPRGSPPADAASHAGHRRRCSPPGGRPPRGGPPEVPRGPARRDPPGGRATRPVGPGRRTAAA